MTAEAGEREEVRLLEQSKSKTSSQPLVKASLRNTAMTMGTDSPMMVTISTPRCPRAAAASAAAERGRGENVASIGSCQSHGRRREEGEEGVQRSRSRAAGAAGLVLLIGAVAFISQPRGVRRYGEGVEVSAAAWSSGDRCSSALESEEDSMLGITASSSMWGVDGAGYHEPGDSRRGEAQTPNIYHRSLVFSRDHRLSRLKGMGGGPQIAPNINGPGPGAGPGQNGLARKPGPPSKKSGEPAMLYDYNKPPVDYLDLDDVQEGWLWIPVAVDKFDSTSEDPLVKMCQVNYEKYSNEPWMLPMGGLLAINSGCAEIKNDHVQIMRLSVLEALLAESAVPVSSPTGFIFHETRCGSTLVANMLASVKSNVMWSESTGPWKVMHTCPKCERRQIVRFLKVIIDAMSRSPHHEHFYFKFQSSEDIDPVITAFPDVPWIFIFREPVEVMMSRLGAQRIGMEGMEKEVAARVEKGMAAPNAGLHNKLKGKQGREANTAQQLSGLCKKAINAFEAHPETGMMVEYPNLPDGIVETVLPQHFQVEVSSADYEQMMTTTQKYSKVASFQKKDKPEAKFVQDTGTKHDAASVAVTEAAQKFLYPDYYKLKSMETWNKQE